MLVSLVICILSPYTAHVPRSSDDQSRCFVTLDVCDAYASFVSADGNGQCLHEHSCTLLPLSFAGLVDISVYHPKPYTPSYQLERPPKS
jgi:hypothetical protein